MYDHSTYIKIILKKILIFFSLRIRMSKKNVNFDFKKIKKTYFYKSKKVVKIDDIDVN